MRIQLGRTASNASPANRLPSGQRAQILGWALFPLLVALAAWGYLTGQFSQIAAAAMGFGLLCIFVASCQLTEAEKRPVKVVAASILVVVFIFVLWALWPHAQ